MSGPCRRSEIDPDDFDEIEVERLMACDQTVPLYRGIPHTPECVEAVRRLIALGMTDREVSERFNGRLSLGAVLKIRKRYGIEAHPRAKALGGIRDKVAP